MSFIVIVIVIDCEQWEILLQHTKCKYMLPSSFGDELSVV